MRTVYKYVFSGGENIELRHMLSPKVVHCGLDPATGTPAVWIELFTENPEQISFAPTDVNLFIVGTGHEVPEHCEHAGSMIDGAFVWHVYMLRTPTPRHERRDL